MVHDDVPQPRPAQRWPADLACGPAFLAPLVLCVLAGTRLPVGAEFVALAGVVAVFGWRAGAPAGLVAVGSSVLSLNGFRENRLGTLALHPWVDMPVALALLCVWAVAWWARESATRSVDAR
jgi:hypothetical protein